MTYEFTDYKGDKLWPIEVFERSPEEHLERNQGLVKEGMLDEEYLEDCKGGWFYWTCFPGCKPENIDTGPFTTEALALADYKEEMEVEPESESCA